MADLEDGRLPNLIPDHPRYKLKRYINRGSHGVVMEAFDAQTGGPMALKFLERGPQISMYVEREIMNQMRLRHPHVINLEEVFLADEHLVLVMEVAAGGDLRKYVQAAGRLSEGEARWFFQQVIFALDYIHRVGVSNRDIKLDNLLLKDRGPRPLIKLSDFGFSKDELNQSAPDSRVGTPAYLPPEVITNQQGQSYNAKKADVWSCGVVLFTMCAGRFPFSRADDEALPSGVVLQKTLQRILKMEYHFPRSRQLSPELKDLITRMLCKDPARRLSVQEVLRHPWCCKELQPSVLSFNDSLVNKTLASPPRREVVEEISKLLQEARTPGKQKLKQMLARQRAAEAAGHGGGPEGLLADREDTLVGDGSDMDEDAV